MLEQSIEMLNDQKIVSARYATIQYNLETSGKKVSSFVSMENQSKTI